MSYIPVRPGRMEDHAGGTAPVGYLLCDGSLYSPTTYPALFAIIGYTYGSVGSNFNVPNCIGRGTIGVGTYTDPTLGTITRTLNSPSGEAAHNLSAAESGLPNHSHGYSDGGHTHTWYPAQEFGADFALSGFGVSQGSLYGQYPQQIENNTPLNITISASTANASNPHNIMQPYLVVTKVIKY